MDEKLCESCSAPIEGENCGYCGRNSAVSHAVLIVLGNDDIGQRRKDEFELLARQNGFLHGGKGSYSKFIQFFLDCAIALRDGTLPHGFSIDFAKQLLMKTDYEPA